MPHLVLLGDSIFDNWRYVPGGPPLTEQVRKQLPNDWNTTLLAVDGHTTRGVIEQFQRLPADATHLVVSAGGNDALHESHVLANSAHTVSHAMEQIEDMRERFRSHYLHMLNEITLAKLPTAVCTVYNAVPGLGKAELAALSAINEIILFEAFRYKIPVIDLRLICNEMADYSNMSPIEPSAQGGLKIAKVIAGYLAAPLHNRSVIFS